MKVNFLTLDNYTIFYRRITSEIFNQDLTYKFRQRLESTHFLMPVTKHYKSTDYHPKKFSSAKSLFNYLFIKYKALEY